jgi:hypothetical protein
MNRFDYIEIKDFGKLPSRQRKCRPWPRKGFMYVALVAQSIAPRRGTRQFQNWKRPPLRRKVSHG